MKKVVAILVAAVMMLAGISAFAAGTPAGEGAAYVALINAGMSRPDFVVRHFDSIAALTAEQLTAVDSYFAAIDGAIKVAVTNVDRNLAGSQLVTIFANANAIAKILKVSYTVSAELPEAIVDVVLPEAIVDDVTFTLVTKEVLFPIDAIINSGIMLYWDAAIAEIEEEGYALVGAAADAALTPWDDEFPEYDTAGFAAIYNLANYDLIIDIYCEENGFCINANGWLSAVTLTLADFVVTGRDSIFAAKSGIRTWFANVQTAVKAIAAYKPAAAAAAPAERLPDTATSYGNLVVLGVVMMVVAAAAVVGIKKFAFNA